MPPSITPTDKDDKSGSRSLVLVILGIILAAFLAFLVLRPSPTGGRLPVNKTTTTPASQH